jgi:beta-glucuronidase
MWARVDRPARVPAPRQQGWNRKGLVSETGVRKQTFDVLADYYRSLEQRR